MFGIKRNKELRTEIGRLEHQIQLMQEHILAQKQEILSQKNKVRELEILLDIAEKRKIY